MRVKCQQLSEYAIIAAVVLSVAIAAQELVKRTLMAKVKDANDTMVNYSKEVRSEFLPEEANNEANNAAARNPVEWEEQIVTDMASETKTNIERDFSARYSTETNTATVTRQQKE